MDVALLVISVFSLALAIVGIITIRYALRDIEKVYSDFVTRNKEMSDATQALGNLHNDHAIKVKSMAERLEVLELRYNGINPSSTKRSF